MTDSIPYERVVISSEDHGYMVLEFSEIADLERAVDLHLSEGWQLVGGISIAACYIQEPRGDIERRWYAQAMVKR